MDVGDPHIYIGKRNKEMRKINGRGRLYNGAMLCLGNWGQSPERHLFLSKLRNEVCVISAIVYCVR